MVMPIAMLFGIGWNAVAGRYVDLVTGQFVSAQETRDILDAVMDGARLDMKDLALQLQSGTISLEEWQLAMRADIKAIQTASGALANGGWAEMSQADWGAVGRMTRTQYEYLDKFANQIFAGDQPLNGHFIQRVDLYGQSGRGTFEEMRRRYETINNGMTDECRILAEADHCNGCLEQASRGWQPIGTLDPIGAEECSNNCHCEFSYRGPGGEQDE